MTRPRFPITVWLILLAAWALTSVMTACLIRNWDFVVSVWNRLEHY